ncbi:MAG: class II aldolase/adducin family protein [Candidatus Gastranaerophilales bacterium]|nr:class II aldolase/adducin family protein [Candidatus Gastranaerophilales bacterium]
MQKKNIIEIGRKLYEKNLTVGTSGNISIKTKKGILITAAGTVLGSLKEKDIVLIDESGKELSEGTASSEKMLHVKIYEKRKDIKAIIHTHPVYLTTFASCHQCLNEPIMSETILYFEDIPVAEYAMPSSVELANNTVKYFENRNVVMMANHGAVAAAENLEKAFLKMETAEYYAKVTLNTRILGGSKYISNSEIQKLMDLKNK